jgi:hypothetical protein
MISLNVLEINFTHNYKKNVLIFNFESVFMRYGFYLNYWIRDETLSELKKKTCENILNHLEEFIE